MKKREPNGNLEGLVNLRGGSGWRVDSTARGPRVDLLSRLRAKGDVFYDKLFAAINALLNPIDTLRNSSRKVKLGLAGTAALLTTGLGANYASHTPQFETPQGVEELNNIGKNVDGRSGVEEARVAMYIEQLPGVFSKDGQEQLRRAALQTDDPPLLGGGDFEKTQRGLDDMVVISQMIEGHDLGNGRFLEFHEEEIQQLDRRIGQFVKSGLASDEIAELHERGDINGIIVRLQDLGQNRDAANAVLAGKEIVSLQNPAKGPTLEGPDR